MYLHLPKTNLGSHNLLLDIKEFSKDPGSFLLKLHPVNNCRLRPPLWLALPPQSAIVCLRGSCYESAGLPVEVSAGSSERAPGLIISCFSNARRAHCRHSEKVKLKSKKIKRYFYLRPYRNLLLVRRGGLAVGESRRGSLINASVTRHQSSIYTHGQNNKAALYQFNKQHCLDDCSILNQIILLVIFFPDKEC